MTIRTSFAFIAAFLLASCGGGGSGGGNVQTRPPPDTPQSTTADYNAANRVALEGRSGDAWIGASNEPLFTDPTETVGFVGGADISKMLVQTAPMFNRIFNSSPRPNYGNTETWRFRVRDGVSWNRISSYLRADAAYYDGNLRKWGRPPTVRVAHGTPDSLEFEVRSAVRLLNSALPPDWQIRFGDAKARHEHRDGEIVVRFSGAATWPEGHRDAWGLASTRRTPGDGVDELQSALVWVDHGQLRGTRERAHVLLHELIHALGRGHVPERQFDDTIMNPHGTDSADFLILHQLDQDALYLVHEDDDWGPWSDVSSHVLGRIGFIPGQYEAVLYGAVARNGLVRPWATGTLPSAPMTRAAGSASWRGKMLGLTPHEEAVAGDVGIGIQFANLTGRIDFTNIEKWRAFEPAGSVGSGTMWGDGDLRYSIEVIGSGFQQTGGDAGQVTGMFFKDNHAQAGGTLRREDLAAGFGAERQ